MKNTKTSNNIRSLAACLALALILIFAFTACSRNPSGQSTAEPSPSALLSPTETPSSPVSGGRVRMAMPENLSVGNESYNPLIVGTEEALELYSLVYEPLIAIDEANSLVPCLAMNWSQYESRPNTWAIHLRDGVHFHTGEKLTADDVVATYRQLVILGSESYYANCLSNISDISRLDASTLLVTMNSPGMINLYSLNFPILRSVHSAFVGTGAYRVTSYNDDRILMQVNADWWDRPPYIEQLEFLARDSNDTALASYGAGQLDLVPTAQLAAGKYSEQGVTVVRDYMTQSMETLLFNHHKSLLTSRDFRSALAHSINRSRIITNVYMNRARSADVPVPPDSWLYNSNNLQYDYSPAAANRLFESLGYSQNADGLMCIGGAPIVLELLVSSTSGSTARAEAAANIASQLANIGITVNVVTAAHSYGQTDSEFMTALRRQSWDIALVGFNLSQSNELAPYLASNGKNNFGSYAGSVFTPLLSAVSTAADEESLRTAFYELQAAFTDELPFLVLYFRLNSAVMTADIQGVSVMREPALLRNIKNWYLLSDNG